MLQPKIEVFGWGFATVTHNGESLHLKDAMLAPGLCQEWDWSKTNTHHKLGIQVADVKTLVQAGARYLILSKGMDGCLAVPPETLKYLDQTLGCTSLSAPGVINYTYEVCTSDIAIKRYNSLVSQGLSVGLLLHSTC